MKKAASQHTKVVNNTHNEARVLNHCHPKEATVKASATSHSLYLVPFFLILGFAFVEFFGGVWTQSLALLSDAWHMFSDVFALGLAWFAAYLSANQGTHRHANGQSHAEIAAAACNALLMLVVVGYIIVEALQRLKHPQPVISGYVMLIAFAGLVVNVIVAKMLHSDMHHAHDAHNHSHTSSQNQHQNHNKRAVYLHVMSDLLGSVAALVAGSVIYVTGWLIIDPILSIFISLLILIVTLNLIKDVWLAYKNG